MMPVAILSGGLATRMRPITEKIPKALIEVAGKPFICHQLSYLHKQGIREVVICTGYLGQMIKDVVGDGSRFGLVVRYSQDAPTLLGTGGAIKLALPYLGEAFFVLYGDSFLPIDFSAVERTFYEAAQPALMTIMRNRNQWDKSNVMYCNGMLQEYNKLSPRQDMQYIDYGLGVISAKVFEDYPDGQPFDLADIYQKLSLKGQLKGHEVYERFYEIGSLNGLIEANNYFLKME